MAMSKRMFYKMFKIAWDKSFTKRNIVEAFRKLGIWPTDGTEMIKMVSKPDPHFIRAISLSKLPKTPLNSMAIRRARLSINRSPSKSKLDVGI